MGENSAISWTSHTFNPWIGCTKVGPGCDGCYAEAMMDKRYGRVRWGAPGKGNGTRSRTSASNWQQPIRWNKAAADAGTRPFVFCASLADVFDNQVDQQWRRDLFDLINETSNLVWLLLTKRPQNIVKMFREAFTIEGGAEYTRALWPRNAAIGCTMVNQEEYDRDRMKLWDTKCFLNPAFTFGSFEPLLGQVILDKYAPDWIIGGGETDQGSHKARPPHPDWFRALREGAARFGRTFHHKQNGEWVSVSDVEGAGEHFHFPDGATVRRVGKKAAGRILDGRTHDEFPVVRP